MSNQLTPGQTHMLLRVWDGQNPMDIGVRQNMGGATRRMRDGLVDRGLLAVFHPWGITPRGAKLLWRNAGMVKRLMERGYRA